MSVTSRARRWSALPGGHQRRSSHSAHRWPELLSGHGAFADLRACTEHCRPGSTRCHGRDQSEPRGHALAGPEPAGQNNDVQDGELPRADRDGDDQVEVVGVAPNAFVTGFNPERPDPRPNLAFIVEQRAFATGRRDPAAPGEITFYLRHATPISIPWRRRWGRRCARWSRGSPSCRRGR